MNQVITPSVVRCPGDLNQRADFLNKLGCERIHIDITSEYYCPGFFEASNFHNKERFLFNSAVDFHVFKTSDSRLELPIIKGDRVIVHYSPSVQLGYYKKCSHYAKSKKCSFGISVNIDTPILQIQRFIEFCDIIMVLSIPIGSSGQNANPDTDRLLKSIKEVVIKEGVLVGVDGGVNEKTLESFAVNSDTIVVGGLLFNADNPSEKWQSLSVI